MPWIVKTAAGMYLSGFGVVADPRDADRHPNICAAQQRANVAAGDVVTFDATRLGADRPCCIWKGKAGPCTPRTCVCH